MIYFDNAATSYPKPISVLNATNFALKNYSFNSGRGSYKQSISASEQIFSVREKVAKMFSFQPENVVFTKNCTEALNIAILGSVKQGDHIVISSLEHNSVLRVVEHLKQQDLITYSIAGYSYNDIETLENFKAQIKPNTSVVICTHSSNAFGVSFPIRLLGKMCREKNIRFIVDAAQGAGISNIDAQKDKIDILCAPGHKSLYGSMGTGFMAFGNNISITPFMYGGTGSSSLLKTQPDFSPDKFESGTLNNAGIISLGKGIDYVNSLGLNNIYNHEFELCQLLYDKISNIDGVKLYTKYPSFNETMPIISFNLKDYSSEKTASLLSNKGICTRAGLHYSPLAHKHFGTIESGTVRISLGAFNTKKECINFIDVVKKL